MRRERRGVAVAAAVPLCVVGVHALATLQSASVGPGIERSAPWMMAPIVLAGVVHWLRPSVPLVAMASGSVVLAMAGAGLVPWGFVPLLVGMSYGVSIAAGRIGQMLPSSIDGAWKRSRKKTIGWTAMALLMVFQVSRLSTFMADPQCAWGSTFPPVEFTITHMCMASYVHAAELSRSGDPNLYDPKHYPNFGITEAEQIDTSVAGLQPYLDDSFHYPPPFLLLPRAWLALSNDYQVIRSVWFAIQLLSFVAFAVLLATWIGGAAGAWSLWMLPLVVGTMPTMFNLQFGQIHLFTFWTAIAGMLAFETKRPVLGGVLLAGGIASKLFPGILVIYLLVQRRWRELAWTTLFGAVFTGVSLTVIGTDVFARFFDFCLPRLVSGAAFSFVTDALVITTNLSVPGFVWKLDLLGIDGASELLGPVSTVYTALLVAVAWYAAKLHPDRVGRVQIWLAVLILASLRSPLVPIYGVAPVLWLMALQVDGVCSRRGLVGFAASWVFVSSVPPTPIDSLTIALYTIALLSMLYWVLRPIWRTRLASSADPML